MQQRADDAADAEAGGDDAEARGPSRRGAALRTIMSREAVIEPEQNWRSLWPRSAPDTGIGTTATARMITALMA